VAGDAGTGPVRSTARSQTYSMVGIINCAKQLSAPCDLARLVQASDHG
jgi:hypothetical protein